MIATRRAFLGRSAGLAGAAVIPASLVGATRALAQADEETDALEPLVELELAGELAYSLAAEEGRGLDRETTREFELFAEHCGDHATALSKALDQLGVDPPEAGSDPAEHERLDGFRPKRRAPELLEFLIALEEDLVAAYEGATEALEAPDLVRTAAQVGAAHAQMLVRLRLLAGAAPDALTRLP